MRKILAISIAVFFSACESGEPDKRSAYFSVPGFFKNECVKMQALPLTLVKKVKYGEKEELVQIQQPQWENELRPFLDCDLNKPAYAGAYIIDSVVTDSTCTVHYEAKEPKTPIRTVMLNYRHDTMTSLYMEIGKSNAWFQLKQEMTYTPGEGYRITGEQKMAIGEETKFSIAGRFITSTIPNQ